MSGEARQAVRGCARGQAGGGLSAKKRKALKAHRSAEGDSRTADTKRGRLVLQGI